MLGAANSNILKLLSIDFTKSVFLATIVAIPLAGFLLQTWLEGFSSRVAIDWWLYPAASVAVWGIALLTVLHSVLQASRIQPAHALRQL